MSKLTDMLRAQFECDHENTGCPKTVDVDCHHLGEAIVDLCDLFDGAGRARDKAFETIDAFHEWIPVTERLPEHYVDVLVWSPSDHIEIGHHNAKSRSFVTHGYYTQSVTHWRPLPKPSEVGP